MNSLGYEVYEINNDNFEYLNGYKDSRDYEVYGDNFIDLKRKIEELNFYAEYLENIGFHVNNIDILSLKDLSDIIYNISNKKLDYFELSNSSSWIYRDSSKYISPHFVIIDLKNIIPKQHAWLYSTSYLLRTIGFESNASIYKQLFVLSTGDLCAYSADYCGSAGYIAGIRPLVTISKSNIKYSIKTKTDGHGTIDVVDTALGGESISFKVIANKGLKLAGLTIITDSGEKVEFDEEEFTTDSSGLLSISTNKFTMPFENITIEARWTSNIINPSTKTGIYIFIIVSLFVCSVIFLGLIRK